MWYLCCFFASMKICNCVYAILFGLLLHSCSKGNRSLEDALHLAGNNRLELEKVLEHYQDSGLKYDAACFLIENMPGAYAVDSQFLKVCQPFYETYDELSKQHDYIITNEWGRQVDSLWDNFSSKHHVELDKNKQDVTLVTANRMIRDIDFAFKVWKENVYTKDCSFETFCEYILPYRRQNGLLIDDSRQILYERNRGKYFVKKDTSYLPDVDSLLFAYRHITHSKFWGTQIPIYDAQTLEKMRHGLCAHRCWYNSLLFSSLGMPVAIDFVPAWGNRNSSHSWNVLLVDGKVHAFDAFWEENQRDYIRLYDNTGRDRWWGKFRLPKVYRTTYSNHIEGPLLDCKLEDIPKLFRKFKQIDVSADYFESVDVTVPLTERIENGVEYAYLSVFNSQEWHPVQWGRIEKGKATFKAMGKDIVYMPVFYKKGRTRPAGAPFLLTASGEMEYLNKGSAEESVVLRLITGLSYYNLKTWYAGCQNNATFWGVKNGEVDEKLTNFPRWIPLERTSLSIDSSMPYRVIRLQLPSDSIALGDVTFHTEQEQIEGVKLATTLHSSYSHETPELLIDGIGATGFRGKVTERYVDFDLGKECVVTKITVSPYLRSELSCKDRFELFYWDKDWQSLGAKQGTDDCLKFDGVPQGVLLMLKRTGARKSVERVFRYVEGEVKWY